MKVKALITAAGMGKRLGALTQSQNKSLLRIGGKPLITHLLAQLKRSGIRDIVVVTGYESSKLVKTIGPSARAVYNPFYRVSGILGSFWQARPFLEKNAFLFTTSDHFFHPSVLRDCLKRQNGLTIVVQKKKTYTNEDAKVIIKKKSVIRMGKDIPPQHADGEFGGMVLFSRRASRLFFLELEAHFKKGGLGSYMMDILQIVAQKYRIPISYTLCRENSRIEVDSVHDLIKARRLSKIFKNKPIK
jgi:choline kinase